MADKYARIDDTDSDEEFSRSSGSHLIPTATRSNRYNPRHNSKPLRTRCSSPSHWPYLKIIKDITLSLLALFGLYSFGQRIATTNRILSALREISQGCDCGESVQEAISLGCKFDSLSMAWLPEHCRDDELTTEFNTMGNGPNGTWIYYSDTLHTKEVDPEEVPALGDKPDALVHMNKQWHTIHCIFYWRKQFRTRLNGKIVEPRSDSEHHIKHCGEIILGTSNGTVSGVALNTNVE